MNALHGSHGSHMVHRKPLLFNDLTPGEPSTPSTLCKSPQGNTARWSIHGRVGRIKPYSVSTYGSHGSLGSRLQYQMLKRQPHGARRQVTWCIAGPSHGEATGGTRSPSIPACKMKLERLSRQRQVNLDAER